MINRILTISKEHATASFSANKKAIKLHMSVIKERALKSMSILEEGNKSIVDKWQKIDVYPFCD